MIENGTVHIVIIYHHCRHCALSGEGVNSPFSAALSRHIGTPGIEVQQMLTRVRAEVVAATRSKQVPWSNSSLLGEVYLAEK